MKKAGKRKRRKEWETILNLVFFLRKLKRELKEKDEKYE
jgi:hypothetical protein